MAGDILKEIKRLCFKARANRRNHGKYNDVHQGDHEEVLPGLIQKLVSEGEYNGLSPLVRAEGAFVQYNSDGSYCRRVGLGVTHTELLIVTQILNEKADGHEPEMKIDVVFPLPALLFILLDNRGKRFAVCTCIGILMFFEMCIDEPSCEDNWDRWRRLIFLQPDENVQGIPRLEVPSWQPVWTSPYVINLSGQNDLQAYEFLEKLKGKINRSLHFIQQPFTIRLVRHIGVQTSHGGTHKRSPKGSPKTGSPKSETSKPAKTKFGEFTGSHLRTSDPNSSTHAIIGVPKESIKSVAKFYLQKLEENRRSRTSTNVPDSTNKEKYNNTILLTPTSAKDETFVRKQANSVYKTSSTELRGNNKSKTDEVVIVLDNDKDGGIKQDGDKDSNSVKLERNNKDLLDKKSENLKIKDTDKDNKNTKTVEDIDIILSSSKGREKYQTTPDQRLGMFHGGCHLVKKRVLETSKSEKLLMGEDHGEPARRSCSCNDLMLSDEGETISKFDQIVVCSWSPDVFCTSLNSSDQILAKKYQRLTKSMQKQSNKRPLKMSSPTVDIDDIDDLVEEYSEKKESQSEKRSGRDLWLLAKKRFFGPGEPSYLKQLQNVVSTYVFKVSSHRSKKRVRKITELTPLVIALELFVVSRKLLLSVSAADVTKYQNSRGKQEVKSLSKILKFSDDVTKMVIFQILDSKSLNERIDTMKFFLEVCQHLLLKHNDFQSFIAIMRALTSLPVYRLRKSWATFYVDYPLHFSYLVCFGKVLSSANGFASYRSRIETSITNNRPCVPWLENVLGHCKYQTEVHRTCGKIIKLNIKRTPELHRSSDLRIKFTTKQTKVKKSMSKKQKQSLEKYFQKQQEVSSLKSILQQPKVVIDPKRQIKSVRFHSKVDVAEKRSSMYDIIRGSRVPLEAKIVDLKQQSDYSDEEIETIDNFSEETASSIMDDVMQEIKVQKTEGNRQMRPRKNKKMAHIKTSGLYLKKKIHIDCEDKMENDIKEFRNEDNNYKSDVTITEHEAEYGREGKENKIAQHVNKPDDKIHEGEHKSNTETNMAATANKPQPKSNKDLPVSKVKTQPNRIITKLVSPFKPKLKREKDEHIQPANKNDIEGDETESMKVAADHTIKTDKQQEIVESKTKITAPYEKPTVVLSGQLQSARIKTKVTAESKPKSPKEPMPSRKRKMSVMEMKKQNRRMSLFEQAEIKRVQRTDNVLDNEINKKMREMKRKGSIAVDLLQPEKSKELSRNNNFPDMLQSNGYLKQSSHESTARQMKSSTVDGSIQQRERKLLDGLSLYCETDVVKVPCWQGDQRNPDSTKKQKNNNNGTKRKSTSSTKFKQLPNSPIKSRSDGAIDTCMYLSKNKCGLCGNKLCLYTRGIWKSLILFQMNILKCDVHSSVIANNCLHSSIVSSSHLSDLDLLKMSISVE